MLFHGSNNPSLSINEISIIRTGQKQAKKGRVFGGFYCTDNIDHAIQYANMCQGIPAVYNVTLRENVKTFSHSGDITRLSEGYINSLLSEGYQMVIGKDIRGRIEYVIIDKSALKEIENAKMRA